MGGGEQAKYLTRMEVYNYIKGGKPEMIVGMGPKAVPALNHVIEKGAFWEKETAIIALRYMDCAESKRALKKALEHEEMGVRMAAVDALEGKDMKGLDEALRGIAKLDRCWNVRKAAEKVIIRRSRVPPPPRPKGKLPENFGNLKSAY